MSRQPLQADETFVFRCTTQEADCRITAIRKRLDSSSLEMIEENAATLKDTEVGEMILRTDQPVVLEEHSFIPELGRFVLERGHDVVAGGIVTQLE